eukprot:236720-Chlamydomonas_euryale.AAC.3
MAALSSGTASLGLMPGSSWEGHPRKDVTWPRIARPTRSASGVRGPPTPGIRSRGLQGGE